MVEQNNTPIDENTKHEMPDEQSHLFLYGNLKILDKETGETQEWTGKEEDLKIIIKKR